MLQYYYILYALLSMGEQYHVRSVAAAALAVPQRLPPIPRHHHDVARGRDVDEDVRGEPLRAPDREWADAVEFQLGWVVRGAEVACCCCCYCCFCYYY